MKRHILVLFLFIESVLAGCRGTVELSIERTATPDRPADAAIERTATPDRSASATIEALVRDNSRLATQVAAQIPPTPAMVPLGRLAYTQGGDIWVKSFLDDSLRAQRLTTDGRNREPRWSPAGEWLAFRKDRLAVTSSDAYSSITSMLQKQVWVIRADGTSTHPLNGGLSVDSFAWSPKSEHLAYTTPDGELVTVNADGTDPQVLLSRSIANPMGDRQITLILWSPDGNWLAYQWQTKPIEQLLPYQGIWIIPASGQARYEVYNSRASAKGEALLAGWSPSSKTLFFWQNESSSRSIIDGGTLYSIPANPNQLGVPPTAVSRQVVLPYADFVTFAPLTTTEPSTESPAIVTGEGRSTWLNKRIMHAEQPLSTGELAAISPAWSPAGDRLAFAAMPNLSSANAAGTPDLRQRHLWIVNTQGDPQMRELTRDANYRDEGPLWSKDGKHLLFVRVNVRNQVSLWVTALDSNSFFQVVDELTPIPDPFDFYGHMEWNALFDWWRGPQ